MIKLCGVDPPPFASGIEDCPPYRARVDMLHPVRRPYRKYMSEPLSLRYIKIRGWAAVLNSIHIICLTYCLSIVLLPSQRRLPSALEYWALAKTAFYPVGRAYRTFYIQRPASHPVLPRAEQRHELFTKSLDTTENHEYYIPKWFLGAPLTEIKRENMREFLQWAFFTLSEDDHTYDAEVEAYLNEFESRTGLHFEDGRTDVKSLRLTMEKVYALHRSLT